jgi:adenylate kinase family enzyme
MQRILVMGSSGSGKSTFARRLSEITNIPAVSMDALFWKPGWIESDLDEFRQRVTEATSQPRWIMDGNYTSRGAGELRRRLSDTIFWFDLPRSACMFGVLRRIAGSYGQVRSEMGEGCPEKIDFDFLRYVWTFGELQRPKLLAYFEALRPDQSLVCFTNRVQADRYLGNLIAAAQTVNVH